MRILRLRLHRGEIKRKMKERSGKMINCVFTRDYVVSDYVVCSFAYRFFITKTR